MTRRTRWIAGLLLAALAAVLATAFVLRRPAPRLPPTAAPAKKLPKHNHGAEKNN